MRTIDDFKGLLRDKQERKKDIYSVPKGLCQNLVSDKQIEDILSNLPKNLTKLEKAYYIYIELGKVVSHNPAYVFSDFKEQDLHYNDSVDSEFYGICKSISELYVAMLKDHRVNVKAELIKQDSYCIGTHVDTVLKIDGNSYLANLISDLSRIKTSRKITSFAYNIKRELSNDNINIENEVYYRKLLKYYKNMNFVPRLDIEQMDKKFGYCFFVSDDEQDEPIYTDDAIRRIGQEFEMPEFFNKYVLKEDVPKGDILQRKLEYIFDNIDKFTDYNGNMNYLERIRYYRYIARKILNVEEVQRIKVYALSNEKNRKEIYSIIKLMPDENSKDKKDNIYYLYSNEKNKYIRVSKDELKMFIKDQDEGKLEIVGMIDRYFPQEMDNLEL